MLLVEASKVDRTRIGPQGSFPPQVVVVIHVADGEFADRAKHRRAKTQPCEVRFGDASPETVLPIHSKNMIVVAHSFQIDKKRWIAIHAKRCRRDKSALQAMPLAFPQRSLWRPGRIG